MVNKVGECSIDGCGIEGPLTRTWCTRHYARYNRTGSVGGVGLERAPNNSTPQELLEYHGYEVTDAGCWQANGFQNEDGYVVWNSRGVKVTAHRVSHEFFRGAIPKGLEVRHRCDNPPCINPEHLEAGTHSENMIDRSARGRAKSTLNEKSVRDIRSRFERGESAETLAEKYGVTSSNIYSVVSRKTWRWVD